MRRFRGSAVALGVLVVVAWAAWLVDRRASEPDGEVPDQVFRFEKEDLVGFRVARPDATLEVRRVDGVWSVLGAPWQPNRAMIRRVAHQLHDLDARANVVDAPEDPAVYGLGDDAIRVTLFLEDGRELAFVVGDPNPTSVSYYMQPLPGARVYVVKKSAMDYYRYDLEAFREDRIATFDAPDAVSLDAVVDGRTLRFERADELTWRMVEPVAQRASRDKVRAMLGRVSAMRALEFVADSPEDLSHWGLGPPPQHSIAVTLATGETLTVWVGDLIEGTDPPLRFVLLKEDDAVYAVKDGFLDSFRLKDDELRDRILLGRHEWDVRRVQVEQAGAAIELERSGDDWRWEDGALVSGSTPRRVAGRAADLRALEFHDVAPPGSGLDAPLATVRLTFEDGTRATLVLGRPLEDDSGARRAFARIEGQAEVFEVDATLASAVEDLVREHARKVERDAEKGLDGTGPGD